MKIFRIGTRGSPLALAQTQEVIQALIKHHAFLQNRLEVIPIKTAGDTIVDRSLVDLGGKSLFTKEIERALLKNDIDFAVHSMKDMTSEDTLGISVPAMLEREDPRDALVTRQGSSFNDLPQGTLFGTSSLRRQAHVLHHYPHFRVVALRGNVHTRLQKIERGEIDATLLAVAGLKRLGLFTDEIQPLSLEDCLPAVAQGAIGIQCRKNDNEVRELLKPLNHHPTFQAVTAERAFMQALNGSCRMPIAAFGYLEGETLFLKGLTCHPQGDHRRMVSHKGLAIHAETIGREAAYMIQEKK
ncbi:MAG: hydroxymethylbilane synthase [Alphaproteobacteria bacterium]|jgi:hydroxymethylbilane synthase|nr:hydroxymethylbilane synthase [Alphaproteobacteria bacterium]